LIICLFHFALLEGKKDLFDETQFKYLKMKNRVFKGALEDFESWENGKATEKYLKRYEELSKLEIGTIISGGILVEPNEAYPFPTIEKDEYIPELKKIVDIVHKNGGNIFAQL
jgi:2,4-dienoyl-CoA reductase-like NADH-dependent reductase (Old Yellow Enzyme family)